MEHASSDEDPKTSILSRIRLLLPLRTYPQVFPRVNLPVDHLRICRVIAHLQGDARLSSSLDAGVDDTTDADSAKELRALFTHRNLCELFIAANDEETRTAKLRGEMEPDVRVEVVSVKDPSVLHVFYTYKEFLANIEFDLNSWKTEGSGSTEGSAGAAHPPLKKIKCALEDDTCSELSMECMFLAFTAGFAEVVPYLNARYGELPLTTKINTILGTDGVTGLGLEHATRVSHATMIPSNETAALARPWTEYTSEFILIAVLELLFSNDATFEDVLATYELCPRDVEGWTARGWVRREWLEPLRSALARVLLERHEAKEWVKKLDGHGDKALVESIVAHTLKSDVWDKTLLKAYLGLYQLQSDDSETRSVPDISPHFLQNLSVRIASVLLARTESNLKNLPAWNIWSSSAEPLVAPPTSPSEGIIPPSFTCSPKLLALTFCLSPDKVSANTLDVVDLLRALLTQWISPAARSPTSGLLTEKTYSAARSVLEELAQWADLISTVKQEVVDSAVGRGVEGDELAALLEDADRAERRLGEVGGFVKVLEGEWFDLLYG